MTMASGLAVPVVALATAVCITAIAILPFLTPVWVAFEQDRSGAAAWSGFSPRELRTATDAILEDLVLGPPDFDVALADGPVLSVVERTHMRDVRGVFTGFFALALVAILLLAGAFVAAGRPGMRWSRQRAWASVRIGALGLAGGIAALGVIAVLAFDLAFEIFHRLFFAQGSYLFDPRTDRLVQLFPQAFWSETTVAVGLTIIALSLIASRVAGRRAR